jgi:hypothetical protein
MLVIFAMPSSIACKRNPPPSTENIPAAEQPAEEQPSREPVQATPAAKPGEEDGTASDEAADETIDEFLKNWPDDVPLMDPHQILNFFPEYRGSRQITILVDASLADTFAFYSGELLTANGWKPVESSKSGVQGYFVAFKATKETREVDLLLKSEEKDTKTLVRIGLKEKKN